MTNRREMRPSGYSWIGEIPVNWRITRMKNILSNLSVRDHPDATVLSLYRDYGVVPKNSRDDNYNRTSENTSSYKFVMPGNLVINKMKAWQGSLAVSDYEGIVSPAYYVCEFTDATVNKRYIHYLLRSGKYAQEFERLSTGMRVGQWDLGIADFMSVPALVPPTEEQNAIVRFLDEQCTKIDEIIAEAKASIENLKKWKQAIISEAVTGGLDSFASKKSSGLEWVESIPKHWEILRLKNIAASISKGSGITKEDIVEAGDSPCVRYGEIYSKYDCYFEECITRTNEALVSSKRYFSYGDILFAGTGELVEEIGKNIVYLGTKTCLAGGDIIIVSHAQNPLFLSYALNSNYCQTQKSHGKAKLKVVHISSTDIGNLVIFLPPPEEQNKIAEYLKEKCSMIDSAISEKQGLIPELEQYKRSLIYETVTGKRKVV